MVKFRQLFGAVYILENAKARRVKVGMTINDVSGRLRDVDEKWSSKKATCQICGTRRLVCKDGLMPRHVVSGRKCTAGNEFPLEKDISIAESHVQRLNQSLHILSGSEKGSVVRQIATLEKRIEMYRDYRNPGGTWRFSTSFYTNSAEQVELLTHEILLDHLDRQSPIGEVFCCSVSEASAAVEAALSQLGLLDSVRKDTRNDTTSKEYGECLMCGKDLTKRGSCPECAERFSRI